MRGEEVNPHSQKESLQNQETKAKGFPKKKFNLKYAPINMREVKAQQKVYKKVGGREKVSYREIDHVGYVRDQRSQ